LGRRLDKALCPPSKPVGKPKLALACYPLCPFPAVFPNPEPGPRPIRFLILLDPGLLEIVFAEKGTQAAPGAVEKLIFYKERSG